LRLLFTCLTFVFFNAATATQATSALAQGSQSKAVETANWSAGISYSYPDYLCAPNAQYSTLLSSSAVCAGGLGIGIGYSLTPNLALLGQVAGRLTSGDKESIDLGISDGGASGSGNSMSLIAGPHWTFNPDAAVRIGAFLALGAAYVAQTNAPKTSTTTSGLAQSALVIAQTGATGLVPGNGSSYTDRAKYDQSHTRGYTLQANAGLTVDTDLGSALSLRFSAKILSAQYQVLKTEFTSSTVKDAKKSETSSSLVAGFGFQPSLALRVAF
jgi:hypothetical protein